jgi:hypothetical protein
VFPVHQDAERQSVSALSSAPSVGLAFSVSALLAFELASPRGDRKLGSHMQFPRGSPSHPIEVEGTCRHVEGRPVEGSKARLFQVQEMVLRASLRAGPFPLQASEPDFLCPPKTGKNRSALRAWRVRQAIYGASADPLRRSGKVRIRSSGKRTLPNTPHAGPRPYRATLAATA